MRLGFREVQKYSGEKHKKPKSDQKDQSSIKKRSTKLSMRKYRKQTPGM